MPTYVVTGPDGKRYRVTAPEGATPAEVQARVQQQAGDNRPTSFWQGALEGITKPAANAARVVSRTNPILNTLASLGLPGPVDALETYAKQQFRRSPNRGSTAGKVTGEIIGTLPTALLPGSGFLAAAGQGAAGGAMLSDLSNPRDIAKNAALGAGGGAIGQQVGSRVLAPVAERIGRTRAARAAATRAAALAGRVTKRPVSALPAPLTKTERITNQALPPELATIRQNISDAADLNLPYSLADADPKLRALAGSVARYSPDGRSLAERNFGARARGQADRAIEGIDRNLAPITNIRQRSTEIMDGGKPVYGPLYDEAYAAPPITSDQLETILRTPAGREAVGRANTIAANEFRDPRAMGFALDEAGNPVLNPVPVNAMDRLDAARTGWDAANTAYENAVRRQQASLSPAQFGDVVEGASAKLDAANAELEAAKAAFAAAPKSAETQARNAYTTQSLDYVKRGIDDILEPQRNPITGKLNLDEGGRAINGVQRKLIAEVDRLNPAYADARSAYQGYARQAEALRTGHEVLPSGTLPQRDFDAILARATDETRPELQRGYATALADQVDKVRMSSNPYNAIYGSPLQQGKVAALYPEGAPRFQRQYDLENDMARTLTETLGGSQTQPRKMADELFQNDMLNNGADAAIQAVSGGGIPGGTKLLGMGLQALKDRSQLGLLGAKKKADALAPQLFDTSNPRAILDMLDELARRNLEQQTRRGAYQRTMGLLGTPAAVLGVSAVD